MVDIEITANIVVTCV